MLTSMITLPVRLGLRGAELGLRAGLAVAERAIDLLGEVVAPTAYLRRSDRRPKPASKPSAAERSGRSESPASAPDSGGGDPRSAAPSPEQVIAEQDAVAAERPAPKPPEPPASPPSPTSGAPEPGPAEPVRAGEPETVVDEVAEPGAEEGAGAQIRIAEPWDGYAQLKAPEVIAQLAGRDQAELAAVELYEVAHRKRQTVIDAAKRELRRADNRS